MAFRIQNYSAPKGDIDLATVLGFEVTSESPNNALEGCWTAFVKSSGLQLVWLDDIEWGVTLEHWLQEIPSNLCVLDVDELTMWSSVNYGDADVDGWSYDAGSGTSLPPFSLGDVPKLDSPKELSAFEQSVRLFEKVSGFAYDAPNCDQLVEEQKIIAPSAALLELKSKVDQMLLDGTL